VFAQPDGAVQVELELAVPFAYRLNETACAAQSPMQCAIYISLSLYFESNALGHPSFLWYSTKLFDLGRDVAHDK